MKLAAQSRAYWTETIHCKYCGKPRPWFLAAKTPTGGLSRVQCIPCKREKSRQAMAKSRAKRSREKIALDKQRDLQNKKFIAPSLRRCRDAYYKIRKQSPKSIPKWVTIESLMPIYDYAERLDDEKPEFRHVIEHVYPVSKDKAVCGLHTIENLRIVRCKRVNGRAFYPTDLHSPRSK